MRAEIKTGPFCEVSRDESGALLIGSKLSWPSSSRQLVTASGPSSASPLRITTEANTPPSTMDPETGLPMAFGKVAPPKPKPSVASQQQHQRAQVRRPSPRIPWHSALELTMLESQAPSASGSKDAVALEGPNRAPASDDSDAGDDLASAKDRLPISHEVVMKEHTKVSITRHAKPRCVAVALPALRGHDSHQDRLADSVVVAGRLRRRSPRSRSTRPETGARPGRTTTTASCGTLAG